MRRDLMVGILISALIQVGVLFGDRLLPRKPYVPPPQKEDVTFRLVMPPPFEPDVPKKLEKSSARVTPAQFAPPMQPDVPQVPTPSAFIQPLQPTPPAIRTDKTLMTIPANRNVGPGPGIQVFNPADLDQRPEARVQVQPQYPYQMRHDGITGEVIVDFIVDADGNVRNAYALRSTRPEFETAAVQAVGQWKFRPGRKGGRAVNTHMQVPIEFTLSDE